MFGLSFREILLILIVTLLILGKNRLVEIAKALGRALQEFKKAASGSSEQGPEKKEK